MAMGEVGRVEIQVTADISQVLSAFGTLDSYAKKTGASMLAAIEEVNYGVMRLQATLAAPPGAGAKWFEGATNELNKLSLAGAQVSTNVIQAKNNLDATAESAGGLMKTLGALADKFSFVFRVAAGITVAGIFFETARAIQDALEVGTRFESILARLAAISSTSMKEFVGLFDDFRRISIEAASRFGVTIDQAAKGLEALVKAGFEGRDAMAALNNVLMAARLEGSSVEQVSKNLVMVMSQFGLSTNETSRALNALLNMSRQGIGTMNDFANGLGSAGAMARALGISIEDAGALMVVLEKTLGNAAEAGTHLNRVFIELYEVAAKLGVPIRDTNGNLRDTMDIIRDVAAAINKFGGDTAALGEALVGVEQRTRRAWTILAYAIESGLFDRIAAGMRDAADVTRSYAMQLFTSEELQNRVNSAIQNLVAIPLAEFWKNVNLQVFQFMINMGLASRNFENFIALARVYYEILRNQPPGPPPMAPGLHTQMVTEYFNKLAEALDNARRAAKDAEQIKIVAEIAQMIAEDFTRAGREVPPSLQNIINSLYMLTHLSGTYRPDFGDKTEDQAEKGKSAIVSLIAAFDELMGAWKDVTGVTKEMWQAFQIFGDIGLLAGFYKWIESYKQLQAEITTLQNLMKDMPKDEAIKYFEKFGEVMATQVRLGTISLEDAKNQVIELARVLGGLPTEPIIKNLIDADNLRRGREETEKTQRDLERLHAEAERGKERIQDWIAGFTNAQRNLGMFSRELDSLNKIIDDLNAKGIDVKLSLPVQQLRDFIDEMNNMSITLKVGIETYNMMNAGINIVTAAFRAQQDVMRGFYGATGQAVRDFMRIVKEKNGLTQEELAYGNQIIDYLLKEKQIREDEAALMRQILAMNSQLTNMNKEQRQSYNVLVDTLEGILKGKERDVNLSLEQQATMQRLQGIQSVLNLYTQYNTIAMQAMQFAMLGNTEAANKLAGFLRKLGDTTADGYMTTDEYKEILEDLGVTFDEQGKPVFNFQTYLQNLATTIENNTNRVRELIDAINGLQDKTITITVNYNTGGGPPGYRGVPADLWGTGTTGGGGGYQGPGNVSGGGIPTPTEPTEDWWAFQHGAWEIPRMMRAILHPREMVLPPHVAEEFRRAFREGRSARGGDIIVNINIPSGGGRGGWFEDRRYWHDVAKIIGFRLREVF